MACLSWGTHYNSTTIKMGLWLQHFKSMVLYEPYSRNSRYSFIVDWLATDKYSWSMCDYKEIPEHHHSKWRYLASEYQHFTPCEYLFIYSPTKYGSRSKEEDAPQVEWNSIWNSAAANLWPCGPTATGNLTIGVSRNRARSKWDAKDSQERRRTGEVLALSRDTSTVAEPSCRTSPRTLGRLIALIFLSRSQRTNRGDLKWPDYPSGQE